MDAVSAAEGTTPTEFARAAILEAVQLHHALTAEEREQVALAAEVEGLSVDRVLPCGHPRSCCAGGTWSWCRCRWCRLFGVADGRTFCHTSWPRYHGHSVAASWSSRCATRFGYAVSIRPACAVAVRPSLGTLGQVFPSFPSGSSILQME